MSTNLANIQISNSTRSPAKCSRWPAISLSFALRFASVPVWQRAVVTIPLRQCVSSHVTGGRVTLWPPRIVDDSVYRDPRRARDGSGAPDTRQPGPRLPFRESPKILLWPWYATGLRKRFVVDRLCRWLLSVTPRAVPF